MTAQSGISERAQSALEDDFLRQAVRFTADRLRGKKQVSTEQLGNWESWRERGQAIRAHTIANLDSYLAQFADRVRQAGGHVHFASDAAEAVEVVLSIARGKGARSVVKSKSMVSEEVHINHHLQNAGIEVVETDLGEYIVQLANETPSHIIIPAIHKTRAQIRDLFTAAGGEQLTTDTKTLAGFARQRLRQKFLAADIGITGCNFGIAETGTVVLFTNEGNADMVANLPKTHIVLMGMERLLPTLEDLEVFANLLPRSATGQPLTAYLSMITGPRRRGDLDGPEELHVVVLDNGRSRQLGDPHFQAVLHCIRCGACLNVCPVYRQIGGHAYGSVYPGPIGAVLTPLLQQDETYADLPYASSLCGACAEACPVKIPLHDMLVRLRQRRAATGRTPALEKSAFHAYRVAFANHRRYRLAFGTARVLQRPLVQDGGIANGVGPLSAWTATRYAPAVAPRSFRARWGELRQTLHGPSGGSRTSEDGDARRQEEGTRDA
ncbi:MAG: iron-sulfur cluster-binding protein [Alicyclobacillus sp.]|nr:iron-sulfur cluster-binding protein [Alicyclobacillus sp.]